jgi:hypothetical protein
MKYIALLILPCLLVACATNTTSTITKENLLIAAGFTVKVASTPQQLAHLQSLPPGKIIQIVKNDQAFYVFAEPAKNQLLFGTPGQYQYYLQLKKERNAALEDETVARMQADTSNAAQWSLWGSPLYPADQ